MSRIPTPGIDTATGATAEVYDLIRKKAGAVPNALAGMGAHGPAALKAILNADAVLASGSLSRKDQETIKLIVSGVAGCDYCVAAHSMIGKMAGLSPDVLGQLRAGEPTGDAKRDALAHFVRLLASTRGTIDESELKAIKAAGYTDTQLVEIGLAFAVIVFSNIFNRINDTEIDFPKVG